ncbi:MAG: class I SAM-dependent methyltransferase [Caldilineaceae bacterium]|nr:class I SAM-dependent methyltransferase [Caldilineaceae bacterium]
MKQVEQPTITIDWANWLVRWDAQQTGYLPDREARFDAMLTILAELLPPDFVALDLCCGPGSISQRLLERFPQARSVAVDLDPVLLAMGQGALGTMGGRLRWAEADLGEPTWVETLGESAFDVVLSTTALHWLRTPDLVRLYHELGKLIRPGGLFLNGDNIKFGPHLATLQQVATAVRTQRWRDEAFAQRGVENWQQWWAALAEEPALADLLAERERRFAWRTPDNNVNAGQDLQIGALREAGFREVGVIWQYFDNCILMAVR